MCMTCSVLEMHLSLEDLKSCIKGEKNPRLLRRLYFIRWLYAGLGVEEACEMVCVSKDSGYRWLKEWNKKGLDGLHDSGGGGRPPKLDKKEKQKLKRLLDGKDCWLTGEIRALIQKVFNVTYSVSSIHRILRGLEMHYAKPYCRDYRRPEDAEDQLAEKLREAVELASDGFILGFLDESSPQTTDNTQRYWSIKKPRKVRNTNKIRANTFGFYPVNGREVVDFQERSTSRHVCRFLQLVREKNPIQHIIIILDNARSHIAKATREYAKKINITLVYLPAYSPDLNPIEQIWKSVKRKISQILHIKNEWSFKETIRTTYHRHAKKPTFMQDWLKTYQPILSDLI